MNNIKNKLKIDQDNINIKSFYLLILFSFVFSIGIRYIWLYQFSGVENFIWNNQIMINTNDGYYFAEGARDILKGSHEANDLSPVDTPLANLTAFLAKSLPISFETLILWMPAVFGSLLVLPIMLIARVLKQDNIGFIAALLGGIALSYYNRTMIGYYDTDMFIVVIPTFLVWASIFSINNKEEEFFWIAPIIASIGMQWHSGIVHIVNGVFIMSLLYAIVFEKREINNYKFLSLFIIALTTLPLSFKVVLIVIVNFLFITFKDKIKNRQIYIIFSLSVLFYLIFGGWSWIVGVLNNAYVTRLLVADEMNLSLKFFGVVNTVREAGHIPFETFVNRISGHMITFWLSVIGYVLLVARYRLMIVSLPMVVLGFFALQGGLRFTVFAVPFMALGVSYFIFLVARYIQNSIAKYTFISLCTVGVLYPNIAHVIDYKVPVVFQKDEVKVLDQLHKIAQREDYVVSWWDYGYPIRYYADVKTLIDGARHSGSRNFPTSFILSESQLPASNMMRLDVEFTEINYEQPCGNSLQCMLKAYNEPNPNKFLPALSNPNLPLPPKTRDVYLYLPHRMISIFPTVVMFENLDLLSGKTNPQPLFYYAQNFSDAGDKINLGNNISLTKEGGYINIGTQKIQLNSFITVAYDAAGKFQRQVQNINQNSPVSAIFLRSYNAFLVVDQKMLNSTFIQLFVLENYDPNLFEPVIMTPLAKVYKLKK